MFAATSKSLAALLSGGLQSLMAMTAGSKLRGQKWESASSFCQFVPVESFLVASAREHV